MPEVLLPYLASTKYFHPIFYHLIFSFFFLSEVAVYLEAQLLVVYKSFVFCKPLEFVCIASQ